MRQKRPLNRSHFAAQNALPSSIAPLRLTFRLAATAACAMAAYASHYAMGHVVPRNLRPTAFHTPFFAVQLGYTPSPLPQIIVQYNSRQNAYASSAAVPYTRESVRQWQTSTLKLTHVDFQGRQNGGSDFRISAPAGVAVSHVSVSLQPPHAGVIHAMIDSISLGLPATSPHAKQNCGLLQTVLGGHTGDSRYRDVRLGGAVADLLTRNHGDYLYFRLDRRSKLYRQHPRTVWVTIRWTSVKAAAIWTRKTFAHLHAEGITRAEINLDWGAIEPLPGKFNFSLLDRTLAHAASAHVRVIPIFWYSVWGGNPPLWINKFDTGSSGAASHVPIWWSRYNRQAYFTYVLQTIDHLRHAAGFGGAFLDFGWLDYMWGPAPKSGDVNGYAQQDIAEFHRWLAKRYRSLALFNRRLHTHYKSWMAIPAQGPGRPLFAAYQHFRQWSVRQTYSHLTASVRRLTHAPLYYYWGGGYSGAGIAFNIPDIFFQLAHRYHVTVCEDCADRTGLMLLFAGLARAYHVPLLEEWTPHPGLKNEIMQFLGHYGFEGKQAAGMDFFLYHGGREFNIGFPPYIHWLPMLRQMHGRYPPGRVGVYFSYRPVFTHPAALQGLSAKLATIWRQTHVAFSVITDRELRAGVVHLRNFKAIYPLNDRHGQTLQAYRRHGGRVPDTVNQWMHYARPYLKLYPAYAGLEAVPMVDVRHHTVWLSLAAWQRATAYRGRVALDLKALGLVPGHYEITNMPTGKTVRSAATSTGLTAPLRIAPGQLFIWKIAPPGNP